MNKIHENILFRSILSYFNLYTNISLVQFEQKSKSRWNSSKLYKIHRYRLLKFIKTIHETVLCSISTFGPREKPAHGHLPRGRLGPQPSSQPAGCRSGLRIAPATKNWPNSLPLPPPGLVAQQPTGGPPKQPARAAKAARVRCPPGRKDGPATAGGHGCPQPFDRCFMWSDGRPVNSVVYRPGRQATLRTLASFSFSLSRSTPTAMAAAVR
jgi:hypothetical protein